MNQIKNKTGGYKMNQSDLKYWENRIKNIVFMVTVSENELTSKLKHYMTDMEFEDYTQIKKTELKLKLLQISLNERLLHRGMKDMNHRTSIYSINNYFRELIKNDSRKSFENERIKMLDELRRNKEIPDTQEIRNLVKLARGE